MALEHPERKQNTRNHHKEIIPVDKHTSPTSLDNFSLLELSTLRQTTKTLQPSVTSF
jgi:hypothetical protein